MKKLGFVLVAGFTLMFGVSKMESISDEMLNDNKKVYRVSDVSQSLKYVIGDNVNSSDEKDLGIAFDINEKNKSVFGDIKEGDKFVVVRNDDSQIVSIER